MLTFLATPLGRWAVIALIVAVAIAAAGLKGYNAGYAKHEAEAIAEVAEANTRARKAEQAGRAKLDQLATTHHQEQAHAHAENDRLRAALRAGTTRLSIPILGRLPTCANFATTPGTGPETRAELDPAAADRIVAIANDGDDAIRQLNAVIEAYGVAVEVCGQ